LNFKNKGEIMNQKIFNRISIFLVVTAFVVAAPGIYVSNAMAAEKIKRHYKFDGAGNLRQPTGYRQWVFVGSPLTPNDMNDGAAPFPEFHHVYIHPDAFAVYKRTGAFPDGTIMVKELLSVGKKQAWKPRSRIPSDTRRNRATGLISVSPHRLDSRTRRAQRHFQKPNATSVTRRLRKMIGYSHNTTRSSVPLSQDANNNS
jgi:hypothetical protein